MFLTVLVFIVTFFSVEFLHGMYSKNPEGFCPSLFFSFFAGVIALMAVGFHSFDECLEHGEITIDERIVPHNMGTDSVPIYLKETQVEDRKMFVFHELHEDGTIASRRVLADSCSVIEYNADSLMITKYKQSIDRSFLTINLSVSGHKNIINVPEGTIKFE